jgi:proteic killer suppression protein
MEIAVPDNKLKAALDDEQLCRRRYGVPMAKKLRLRMASLYAAASLVDFWPPKSGPERCHELIGPDAGLFSVDLNQPFRLLFRAIDSPPPLPYPTEQDRWRAITRIELVTIADTHG